jgi:hypothetical protein
MSCSILIPTSAQEKTMKRLGRLAKQANVELTVVPGSSYLYRKTRQWRERLFPDGRVASRWQVIEVDPNVVLECSRVTVGELPRENGFEFLGKIVHTEAGNMLMMAAHARGEAFPEEWKTAKPTCDHCHTKRSRKDTFIIRTPEGVIQRVGRNCLADFLKTSPATMIAISAFQDELLSLSDADPEDEGGYWGGGNWGPTVWRYLTCAVAATRKHGFVKSTDYGDSEDSSKTPTKSVANFLANPRPSTGNTAADFALRKHWEEGQPTDLDMVDAVGALLWLEQSTDTGQYMHNLTVACSLPALRRETMGLIASLPAAYNRAMGKLALQKKEKEVTAQSQHVGTVGERLEVEATILTVQPLESQSRWGSSDLVKLVTDEGCVLVTFTTSASSPRQRDVGKRYTVKGTVKKHDNYKGTANTRLTRCAFTCLEEAS